MLIFCRTIGILWLAVFLYPAAFAVDKESFERGKSLYNGASACFACHQTDGGGLEGQVPPLKNSDWVKDDESRLIAILINGLEGSIKVNGKKYNGAMPPQTLSNEQVADVLTYIRGAWGNNASAVGSKQVKEIRKLVKKDGIGIENLMVRFPFSIDLMDNNGAFLDEDEDDHFDATKVTIVRTFMPGASPAAFAVAFPGEGPFFCWDAGECRLRYIWREGGFIAKQRKHWLTNGKKVVNFPGKPYYLSQSSADMDFDFKTPLQSEYEDPIYNTTMFNDFPIRIGLENNSRPEFKGYRMIKEYPEFMVKLGEHWIYERIEPMENKRGVRRIFSIDGKADAIEFALSPSYIAKTTCDKGRIYKNTLYLSQHESLAFTITQLE